MTVTGAEGATGRVVDDDPASIATRRDLADRLSELRGRSGFSVRKLAALIDVPSSTLGDWFSGATLPFARQNDVFRQLITTLGVTDPEPWIQALVRLRARSGRAVNPYRGLASYAVEDAQLFCGRESLTDDALRRFDAMLDVDGAANVLFVVGASGCGKTSFLNAALRPALQAHADVVDLRLGDAPLAAIEAVARLPANGGLRVLLVDQFEELYTLPTPDDERQRAIDMLISTCTAPGRAAIVCLRADFFGEVASHPGAAVLLQCNQVVVGPMSEAELRACVVRPAESVGLRVDDELVDAVVREFAPTASLARSLHSGALPLLSQALRETANIARAGVLTLADYRAVGGIERAVGDAAERAIAALSGNEVDMLRALVPRLVNIDALSVLTRRPVSHQELDGLRHLDGHDQGGDGDTAEELAAVVETLTSHRILTATSTAIELTHEALLTSWPRLRDWIEEDRARLAVHRSLTESAHQWEAGGHDPALLLRGVRLETALPLDDAAVAGAPLNALERVYLRASVEHRDATARLERRRTARLRLLAAAASVLAVVAAGMAAVTLRANRDATTARDEALSREIALLAASARDADPSLAAYLSVAAYDVAATVEARSAVLDTTVAPRSFRLVGGPGPTALALAADSGTLAVTDASDSTVRLASITDGRLQRRATFPLATPGSQAYAATIFERVLAVGGSDSTVTLWSISDPDAPSVLGSPLSTDGGVVFDLDVRPGLPELAAATIGAGVRRWDISDADSPRPLPAIDSGDVQSLSYAPDGSLAATGGTDGVVRIWALDGNGAAEVAALPIDVITTATTVEFSPDGTLLAAGYKSKVVRLWDVTDPAAPIEMSPPAVEFTTWVNTLAFSRDGSRLAAGSSDSTVRIWDTSTWSVADGFRTPDGVTNVRFTPEGDIVSTSTDGAARLWDMTDRQSTGLDVGVWSAEFARDGDVLVAVSGINAGVWSTADLANPVPFTTGLTALGDGSWSGVGDVSPDGTVFAAGGRSGEVQLIDISDPADPRLLAEVPTDSAELVETVALSPDGSILAAGGDDTIVRLWDVSDPRSPRSLARIEDAEGLVINVAFSPDGQLLAFTGTDKVVHLSDISDPSRPLPLAVLGGFEADTQAVAFSPDGLTLVVGGAEEKMLMWDISDPAVPVQRGAAIEGLRASVMYAAFSPDGRKLAAVTAGHALWMWDIERGDPQLYAVLEASTGPLYNVTFSADSSTVVGAGADSNLYFWEADVDHAIESICGSAGDRLTVEEWHDFIPTRRYVDLCGG